MKNSPLIRTFFPSFFTVFLISIFIVFAIMEFSHTANIISQYEDGIQQIALSNTNQLLDEIKNNSVESAKKFDLEYQSSGQLNIHQLISTFKKHPLVKNIYILNNKGSILASSNPNPNDNFWVRDAAKLKNYAVLLSPVHTDSKNKNKIVTSFVALQSIEYGIFAIDYSLNEFQDEMLQKLVSKNYTVAVLDQEGNEVVWPFEKKQPIEIIKHQKTFIYDNKKYNVMSSETDKNSWIVYFFFQENNIEIFRAVTILLLVFALYVCLYELLVEYWGVNTAKTYFENIDFAIFNQINEGVIIANNSGRILFANETAHNMFVDRKNILRNVRLNEILGNIDLQSITSRPLSFSLKLSDKLLKAIHSPIIKNNKILGSLTVIRNKEDGDNFIAYVMDKVFESIPQGIIFINKQHEIAHANIIAKCFFGNLIKGTSIEMVNRELADFIYKNIDSPSMNRVILSTGIACEITPVHDEDGIYVGTVIYIINDASNT